MRATRYLWISNLPVRTSEQDIRDVLQSHGKIQSIRIHSGEATCSAVVAFVDTKSATRAIESTVRLNKTKLSLQYCESSGVPGNNTQESVVISSDNSHTVSSVVQNEETQLTADNRSVSGVSDSGSSTQERRRKSKLSSRHSGSPRSNLNGSGMSVVSNERYETEQRGLHIRHLPLRSSDTNLREGLFHEYKKHGKITSVVIRGQGEDRYCIITFKRAEDAERAFEVSRGKVFFGTPISVTLHEGVDSEDPDLCPPEHALDEYHPKATKTLFVGNLCSSTITQDELRRTFRIYGEIIEIDIKIQANQPGTSYAFVQFGDIKSVVRALSNQETIRVGGKPVKLGFGKSQPTNVVWLDNLAPTVNESFLARQFGRYGHLTHVVLDRKSLRALLYFDTVEMAQRALNETRNRALIGRKVQLDYAGYECQVAFVRRLAKHDGFSQVYDNYREKIQELLSLWPPYGNVLPLLERQRYFGDVEKDIPRVSSDDCSHSNSRKSVSRRTTRGDRNVSDYSTVRNKRDTTSSSRQRPQLTKDQFGSGYVRHHTSGKEALLETSPLSDAHGHMNTQVRRLHVRSSHQRLSAINYEEHGMSVSSPSQRNSSQVCEPSWRLSRHSGVTSKSLRSGHSTNSHVSTHQPSHYLDETDDVSSGSLSPDLDPEGSNSDASPIAHGSLHAKSQRFSTGSVPRDFIGIKRQTSTHTCAGKGLTSSRAESTYPHSHKPHGKCYRDSPSPVTLTKKMRSVDMSRVPCRLHTQPPSCSVRTPTSPQSSLSRDFANDTLSRSSSRELYTDQRSKRAARVSGGSYEVKADRENISRESHSRCSYHSEEKSLHSQSVDLCSESHDTLTKLERERAKLLKELSKLNSEVGNHKSTVSTSGKKRPPSDIPDQLYAPKMKRPDPHRPTDIANNAVSSSIDLPATVCSNMERIRTCNMGDHSTLPCSSQAVRPSSHSSTSRPSNGCHSSSSEPGDLLSPIVAGRATCLTVPDVHPTMDAHVGTHLTEHRSPVSGVGTCLAISRRPNVIASSPRLVMPPEPTSPLTGLSPGSPAAAVEIQSTLTVSIPSTSNQTISPIPASALTRKSTSSPTQCGTHALRDPRLVAHQAQASLDIPPPPPPPPECLKLPLWVDTSQFDVSSLDRFPPPPPPPPPPKTPSSSNIKPNSRTCISESDPEVNSSQEAGNFSLDERIRLLDAQLLKSEKARPAVDYSKFRIRRKAETTTSSVPADRIISTAPSSSSPAILTSLTSVLPVSPVNELSSVYPRVDRVLASDCTPTTPVLTTASSVGYSSPKLPCPASPIAIPRLADTSEFVKSMLSSSKPSPSNPSDHVLVPPLDVAPSRSVIRYPSVSSPLPASASVENSTKTSSIASTSSGTSNFITRQFVPLNARLLTTAGCSVHNSLNGTQPIGVATRLPSISTSHVDCSLNSSHDSMSVCSESSHVKSILKKDVTKATTFESSTSKPYIQKQPPSVTNLATVHDTAANVASNEALSSPISRKHSSDTIEQKSDKSSEQFTKLSTNHVATRQPSSLKPTRQLSTEIKKPSGPTQVNKLKNTKMDANNLSGASKASKVEPSRPTLDDSVFKTSLEAPSHKIEKKRNRIESHHVRAGSSLPSNKLEESSTTTKTDVTARSAIVSRDLVSCSRKATTSSKRSVEGAIGDVATERTPLFEKHKPSLIQNDTPDSVSESVNKESKTFRAQLKGRPAERNERNERGTNSVRTKKKPREGRKRVVEDNELEENEVTCKTSAKRSGKDTGAAAPLLSGYESMYDKIKRRANKDSSGEKSSEKTGVFQRLLKARGKTGKQTTKRNRRVAVSSVDSDTDQCLSDDSSMDDDLKTKTKERLKIGSRQLKSSEVSDRLTKQKSGNVRCKNTQWSNMSCLRKNRDSDGNSDGRIKTKLGRPPTAKSETARKQRQSPGQSRSALGSNTSSGKRRSKGFLRAKSNTKFPYRGSTRLNADVPCLKKREKQRPNKPNAFSLTDESNPTLKPIRKKVKSSSKQTEGHRSLVHRMFASTDSETPSLSSSETEVEDNEKQFSPPQTDLYDSRSGVSRSCSPDDLDVDDAIRHTFGAFARPVISTNENKSSSPIPTANTSGPKCSSSPDCYEAKSHLEAHTMISKSTPPTLPMLDSSSSVDQLVEPQQKLQSRVSTEWNIFTSLTSNTLPVMEPYPRASTPTAPKTDSDKNLFIGQHKFSIDKSGSDLEDELPSLEKHDDDEASKLDTGSLLLNDSSSLLNPVNASSDAADDDLPPPVVSAVGDYSPNPLINESIQAQNTAVTDVIEEVVYDGLEVPVASCEVIEEIPLKPDPSLCETDSAPERSLPSSAESIFQQNSVPPSLTVCTPKIVTTQSNSFETTVDSELPVHVNSQAITVSSAPLTLPSTVFTPIAMLAPGSHSDDLPGVAQPLLVTVPGSTTGVTFTSSGLALLPASLPTSPTSLSKSAQVPRHVALILPATPISLSSSIPSSTQAPVTTSILNTTTLVYNTAIANSPGTAPPVVSTRAPSATATVSNISARNVPDSSSTLAKAFLPPVAKPPISDPLLRGSSELPVSSETGVDVCSSIEDQLNPPIHNVTQDHPDYTSYVQRVIERVKQEKDEEVSHQREKIKRPKKIPTSMVPIPCLTSLNSSTVNSVVLTLTTTIAPTVSSLTPIAPMPTVSSISLGPKISVKTKSTGITGSDGQEQYTPSDPKYATPTDPNEKIGRISDDANLTPLDQGEEGVSMPISMTPFTDVIAHETVTQTKCEFGTKSSVDEVIDAVLEGQFDENEYVEKILKGVFDQSFCQTRSDFCSPSHSFTDPNSPLRTLEESGRITTNNFGSDKASVPTSVISSAGVTVATSNCARTMDTITESSPQILTPMHVLTLVATNAATPQKMSSVSAVSPNTPQTPHLSTMPPTLSQCANITKSEPTSTLMSSGTLPTDANLLTPGSLPVSGIEQLTAPFSNNPLTSYFYSLLTRQSLSTSTTPAASTDPTACKLQDAGLPVHVSSALQNSLKGLNLPSTGEGADYIAAAAAAAMAAMAAMTSSSGALPIAPLDTQISTSGLMTSLTYSHPSEGQPVASSSSELSLVHEYPVSWRGRLSLKNEEVHVQMHYLNGNEDLLKSCLSVIAEQQALATNAGHANFDAGLEAAITQPLKIVQRMRLEPSQLEGVQRKLRQTGDYCMCLTLAASPPGIPEGSIPSERARMNQVLCDGFIKYMVDKCAAGIINVCHPSTQQNLFVIHIFPPCKFARCQLDGCAPNLLRQLTQYSTPHLLIVVTTV